MRRINHIFIIIYVFIFFILSMGFVEWLREHSFYILIALLVIFIAIFWKKKQTYDIYTNAFILLVFITSKLLFRNLDDATLVLRTSAILSFFFLHLVLLIGPWSRFSGRIIKVYHYRRHLGVTVLLLGWLHASIVFSKYFMFSVESAFSSIFTFYGFTALFIMIWLGITSWDYVQKKFKDLWWKILHGFLLIIYTAMALYVYRLQKSFNEPLLTYHALIIGIFILIWILVAPYSIIKKIMKTYVFGWKQLHVLIYIAYFSLLLHVLLGALTTRGLILKLVFWISILLVLGSHITGWIKKMYEDRKINKKMGLINQQFTEDNKLFIGIAHVNEFEEGKGKRFYVKNNPIAVFKNEGNFIAISNICAHQKGPLYKGRVEYGMVECPWHYWTYELKTGCTLGKERFCIPAYETRIKDDTIFVSAEPKQS